MMRTRTAEISVTDHSNGVIVSVRIQPQVQQTLDDARANVDACIKASGNRRSPLMVDISKAELISAEVRHYLSGEQLAQWFSALALLVEASPLGRVMGNLYLRIARPGLPTQLFVDENAAMAWLRQQRQ